MTLQLFAHPFSSYSQKVLVALYENATPFDWRSLDSAHPDNGAAFAALWPISKFPLLLDGDRPIRESTAIIEYLDLFHPGPVAFVPDDPQLAVEVRMLDRIFDNYVMTPMQAVVSDALRPADVRDPYGVAEARDRLDTAYRWLDRYLEGRLWAAGEMFSLADCAAAPSLFYADWTHPLGDRFPTLSAYRTRLLARPSFARAVDEARPYRSYFPLGAPDRD